MFSSSPLPLLCRLQHGGNFFKSRVNLLRRHYKSKANRPEMFLAGLLFSEMSSAARQLLCIYSAKLWGLLRIMASLFAACSLELEEGWEGHWIMPAKKMLSHKCWMSPLCMLKLVCRTGTPYYICRVNSWKTFGTAHFIPTCCLHENLWTFHKPWWCWLPTETTPSRPG